MNKAGIFIIELQVYMILSLLLATISFKIIAQLITGIQKMHTNSLLISKFYAINKILATDLAGTSCAPERWFSMQPEKIKFYAHDKRITWQLKAGELIRSVRTFDAKHNRWKKESSNKLSARIASCAFRIALNQHMIDSVTTLISMDVDSTIIHLEQTIWPMLGRIIAKTA